MSRNPPDVCIGQNPVRTISIGDFGISIDQLFMAICLLDLLPIWKVEEKFSPDTGRPTKELYSVTGLLLIMEFFGWSMDEAVDHLSIFASGEAAHEGGV